MHLAEKVDFCKSDQLKLALKQLMVTAFKMITKLTILNINVKYISSSTKFFFSDTADLTTYTESSFYVNYRVHSTLSWKGYM